MSNAPTITYVPEKTTTGAAWYDSITGSYSKESNTSSADSMDSVSISFLVPEGYEAALTASIGVDDWGALEITNAQTGAKVLVLSLTSDDDDPGPNGGHTYWEKSDTVTLPAGTYTISVSHQNITYPSDKDPKYNAASCNFSITATKTHLSHTVSTVYTLVLSSDSVSITCPITINATCGDNGCGGKVIENVQVSATGDLQSVALDTSGYVNRIVIDSLAVEFLGDTVNDESTNIAARLVCVYWTARVWDHADGDAYPDGRIVSGNSNMPIIHDNPTLFCSFS